MALRCDRATGFSEHGSGAASSHALHAITAGTELYSHSDALSYISGSAPTHPARSPFLPQAVSLSLSPQFTNCIVVVDNRDLRKGSILPGAPARIASGMHAVSLKCPDNTSQPVPPVPAQQIDVPPGLDPVIVSFPRGD